MLLLLLMLASVETRAQDGSRPSEAAALEQAMIKAIEKAEPSIACLLVTRNEDTRNFKPLDPQFIPEIYGSGVVIDPKGLVLTNEHVIRNATRLFVRLPDERGGYASVWASDQRSDLAVLQINGADTSYKAIPLGAGEKLRKGQFVLSLANPFAAGFRDGSPSASWGIISNLRRRGPQEIREERSDKPLNQFATLIQTDARLNLGCSGGALIDLDGKLVGLTTALAALSGTETPGGFGLPMDTGIRRIVERLRRGEEVEYGFLGVIFPQGPVRRGEGVLIGEVIPGGPADKGRLPSGCVVLSIEGHRVHDREELSFWISTALAGSHVKIEYRPHLGNSPRTAQVELAKLYVPGDHYIAGKRPPQVGGLRVDYTSTLTQRGALVLRSPVIPPGVVVRQVEANSPAERARIQGDAIITEVNGRAVNTPAEFYAAAASAGQSVELTIQGRAEKIRLDLR
jgi:S1-C subfamily serine protease